MLEHFIIQHAPLQRWPGQLLLMSFIRALYILLQHTLGLVKKNSPTGPNHGGFQVIFESTFHVVDNESNSSLVQSVFYP